MQKEANRHYLATQIRFSYFAPLQRNILLQFDNAMELVQVKWQL